MIRNRITGKTGLALRALLALALGAAAAPAQMETPLGGWRQGNPEAPYTQIVNYPASSPGIDAGVPLANQIRGRIKARAKQPATLIVNGNVMPLRVDEGGAYARPYSFSGGSNSVEVRAGEETQRVQFYQLSSGQAQARLRILLTWDTDGTDLDLHVLTPGGGHAWYGERVISSGAIDTDVTTGFGPEIFASPAPEKGLYQIFVNYYGGGYSNYDSDEENDEDGEDAGENDGEGSEAGGSRRPPRRAITTARLTVITEEGTASEKRQEFTVPMRFSGELTQVCQFIHP